jgi:RecB family exonuclease
MKIEHMSVSRRDTWRLCEYQYVCKYVKKLKTNVEEPLYFAYGRIVHRIAEDYVKSKGSISPQKICGEILTGKVLLENHEGKEERAPNLPQSYRDRLKIHLRNIEKITKEVGFEGETEWGFEYDLDPPNKKLLVGFLDRLVDKKDEFFILDYKTTKKGRYRKTRSNIGQDLQLRAYARVVQNKFTVPASKIKAALYYLEDGQLLGAKFSEANLAAAEKELLDTYKEIEVKDAEKVWGTIGQHCDRCDYKTVCPFINKT